MPFKKMDKTNIPPRHWVLVGFPGSGKSTFSTQMRGPLLPIDADHRYQEVAHLAQDVYELSSIPADAVSPEAVHRLLNQNMPGSDVRTIIVDSLTTIIAPKVVEAIMESDARRERNKEKTRNQDKENLISPFKDKALAMRLLQDAVTKWGTDTLWIYHLQSSRDEKANLVTRPILSSTERARLYRSINMELHVIEEERNDKKTGRRGIKVVWARRGRSGMTLWDDTGKWTGMPERIEQAVYSGLSVAEQEKLEQEAPAAFPTREAALEWANGQGVYKDFHYTKNSLAKLERENPGLSWAAICALWVEKVEEKVAQKQLQAQAIAEATAPVEEEQVPTEAAGQAEDDEPLEERFDFTLFCDSVMHRLPFYQDPKEIIATLEALKVVYDSDREEHIFDVLNVHYQTLPAFETSQALLSALHKDFGLEAEVGKARLKELGFTGFPTTKNGDREMKTRRMYWAVKLAMAGPVSPVPEQAEEEPF